MSRDSSAKYYIKNLKKDYKKRLVKGFKIFLEKNKYKSEIMITNNIKIVLKTKSKNWLSVKQT